MTEHVPIDHDDTDSSFDWVARAYDRTPSPSGDARDRAINAVSDAVSAATHTAARGTTDTPRSTTPVISLQPRHTRWIPVAAILAAAAALAVWWTATPRLDPPPSSPSIAASGDAHHTGPHQPSPTASSTQSSIDATQSTATQSSAAHATTTAPQSSVASNSARFTHDHANTPTSDARTLAQDTRNHATSHPSTSTSVASTVTPPTTSSSTPSQHTTPAPRTPVDGLDAESATFVTRILDSASAQGLPLAPLVARVREGVRRGVPGPRIVVVTRNYAAALAGARSALGRSATPRELQSGAEALLAGTPVSALQRLRTEQSSTSPATTPRSPHDANSPKLPIDSASVH